MKHIQFILSVLVTIVMFIILVYEDKNQLAIRWMAAGVGFAALAFQLLLYFTPARKEPDATHQSDF